MKYLVLTAFVLVASSLAGMPAAFALSSQAGNGVPGVFANLADPDEQYPPFLKGAGAHSSSSPSDSLDADHDGQGFISKDVVQQSVARGSGSYLPPDAEDAPNSTLPR